MIAHPPLNSTKNNNKLNNIRKRNYSKKKTNSNDSKKRLSEIEKLEMENHEMEQRLLELKHNLAREKEKRLKQGKTSFWQSGKKGVLYNHGNEVIYNKNIKQMKNKNNIFGISLNSTPYESSRNSTFNLLTTSSLIHRSEGNKKNSNSNKINKSDINSLINGNSNKQKNNVDSQDSQTELNNDKNNISFTNNKGGLINFNKYIENTTDHINSINLSSNDEKMIIKSKYDEVMKNKSLESLDNKKSTGNNTSYDDYEQNNENHYNNNLSYSNHSVEEEENNNNERLIDGEFNEEESHNSFIEALNMWRKERREQNNITSNTKNDNKPKVTFAEDYNNVNASETQTKELDTSLNIDEIVKNMQNSKSNLSYMERLALYKYREQFKKDLEEGKKAKSEISVQDYKIEDIDEEEINTEVEKYWENNMDHQSDEDEKEIETNLNLYVNQYKLKQLELREKIIKINELKTDSNNTKTSVIIDDNLREDDDDIEEFDEYTPIVTELDDN
ncbi:hypothetical protein BCR32DRAFT_294162 [Anaeromyces robustus]|uniref:Uncharacterized protein n=1 Tax=Anaeromyces robustus TaxID=1754192 RepID=A0A1Y1X284_9FUNG|nr:hypothetical protein BCR32DRAFT_294162 [Anaeromyces robustus]|eukprot:ORX79893.1 hypothetical protein BCR32DRAFT_294162 [Anaeromyces robustus]